MPFKRKEFIFFALVNLAFFYLFCFFIIRYGNILQFKRHDTIEHIFAGLGFTALFIAFFAFLMILPTIKYLERKRENLNSKSSYIVLCILGIFASLAKTVWWELYSTMNTFNHFYYDFVGIVLYMMILLYWFYQRSKRKEQ